MIEERVGMSPRQQILSGVPVEERILDLDGTATTVLEGGSGPPLVLIHGGSQAAAVNWLPVLAPLTERFRVVAPDLPGLGESAPLPRFSADDLASWLDALVAATCDGPPTVVAHSLPAGLTARFAATRGTSLRQLVLVGAPALGRGRPPLAMLLAAIRLNARPSPANLERFSAWPYHDLERVRGQGGPRFAATSAYLLSRAAVPHVKRTMRQLVRHGAKALSDEELLALPRTTGLLWGRHDRMAQLAVAERTSERFGWPLRVVDDAGHLPFVEQPAAFLAALRDLVDTPA